MVPYLHLNNFKLGPLVVNVWGIFFSLGFLASYFLAYFLIKKKLFLENSQKNQNELLDLALVFLLGGIVGGRLFHIFFYQPKFYWHNIREIFNFWGGGFSSIGGMLGVFLGGLILLRKRKANLKNWFDLIAFVLPVGWLIGRIGCFLTHQHLGLPSRFFLAVKRPEGTFLEMSLLEIIFSILIFLFFVFLLRRKEKLKAGFFGLFFVFSYSLFRFVADFWRLDVRYFFLTPAQIFALAILLIILIYLGKTYAFKKSQKI